MKGERIGLDASQIYLPTVPRKMEAKRSSMPRIRDVMNMNICKKANDIDNKILRKNSKTVKVKV